MKLLIDFGNTRWKWRVDNQDKLVGEGACEPHDWASMRGSLDKMAGIAEVKVASVAGKAVDLMLAGIIKELFAIDPRFAQVKRDYRGLRVAYQKLSHLGVDRWLAMLAVHCELRRDFVVIQVGSAITVDYVDAGGQHKGGLITPGITMMRNALYEKTAGVKVPPLTLPQKWHYACDTIPCVANGVGAMIKGFLTEVLEDLPESSNTIISGGDANTVASLIERPVDVRPALVFTGLRLI